MFMLIRDVLYIFLLSFSYFSLLKIVIKSVKAMWGTRIDPKYLMVIFKSEKMRERQEEMNHFSYANHVGLI
jgi:hypothetical protein